jgi:signal transduction histidine kinase
MNSAQFIPLMAAIVNLALALFVFSRDKGSRLNRWYLVWGMSIAVWNLGTFFMFRVSAASEALFWARFLQFGVIALPISFFALCVAVAQMPIPKALNFFYVLHALLAASNFTPLFVSGVRSAGYAFYSVAGPCFWIYLVSYTVLSLGAMVVLVRRQRTLSSLHRMRVRSLILASLIIFVFGNNDILPILGFYHYPFTKMTVLPLGSLAAILYGMIVGYSVLQHRLLNVQVAMSKIVAQVVRLSFVFLLGLTLLLVVSLSAPPNQFPLFAFASAFGVLLVSVTLASIFFPRLFGKGEDALERRILGDRFEYHDQVKGFIQSIQWYTDADSLMGDLHDLLVHTLRVRSYQIILLDEATRAFALVKSFPPRSEIELLHLDSQSPIFEFFKRTEGGYLACNSAYAALGETPLEQAARAQIGKFEPEVCFPFVFDESFFGLLLIGEKVNREPYTVHDLNLLLLLAKNLSLTIYQIRLKKQVLLAEELDLLGRMSRGMAHDLNNLLVPVSTLLQLCADIESNHQQIKELLPMASRNVRTIRTYISEALFFSQHHSPQITPARLDLVLRKAVELAEQKLRRRNIEAVINSSDHMTIEIDSVLIQRLISNILSNAIDASPPGSKIFIELQLLARTEQRRDWVRIRVIDQGEGISQENLDRIASPYFTTKDKGDETRGFGLGLSICRKIVHLHGGTLRIFSEEKKGTVVQVDLPSRQIKTPQHAMAAIP